MCVYCLEPVQSPVAHGAFCDEAQQQRDDRGGEQHAQRSPPRAARGRRRDVPTGRRARLRRARRSGRCGWERGRLRGADGPRRPVRLGSRIVTRSSWHAAPRDQPGLRARRPGTAGAPLSTTTRTAAATTATSDGQFGRTMPGEHVGLGFGLVVGGLVVGGADVVVRRCVEVDALVDGVDGASVERRRRRGRRRRACASAPGHRSAAWSAAAGRACRRATCP